MTEFGKRGISLLREIINYEPNNMSSYNEELVRLVFSEIDEHYAKAQRVIRDSVMERAQPSDELDDGSQESSGEFENPADAVALVVHFESIARNKKLLMSYMMQRMERLKTIRWVHRQLPEPVRNACCPQEVEFYRAYDQLLTKYMSKHEGIGHDLTLDMEPPSDNLVNLRVVRDAGVHLFSFGPLGLHEGQLVKIPFDEAQPLVTAGILEVHNRSEFMS